MAAKLAPSFGDAIDRGTINLNSATFLTSTGEIVPLKAAISNRRINCDSVFVKNVASDQWLPLLAAVDSGIVDFQRKLTLDPFSRKAYPLIVRYPCGIVIPSRKRYSFEYLNNNGFVNLQLGIITDPLSGCQHSISAAIDANILDPFSAFVIDKANCKMLNLAQAAISLTGNVSLQEDIMLLPSNPIPLLTVFKMGLYWEKSQLFRSPFRPCLEMSLHKAIINNLISINDLCLCDEHTARAISLSQAMQSSLYDSRLGLFSWSSQPSPLSLLDLWRNGFLKDFSVGKKESVEEAFQSCQGDTDSLLLTLLDLQNALADELESADASEDLAAKIARVQALREHIAELEPKVSQCLELTDQLSTDGADIFSPEEFNKLRKGRNQLKEGLQQADQRTSAMLKRLQEASKVKDDFEREAQVFKQWANATDSAIDQVISDAADSHKLSSCRDRANSLTNDVTNHVEDLQSIKNLAAQLQDELRGYAEELHALRLATSSNYRPRSYSDFGGEEIRRTVLELSEDHQSLVNKCDRMRGHQQAVEQTTERFKFTLREAEQWINQTEQEVNECVRKPPSGDATELQNQLDCTRDLMGRIVNANVIDEAKAAADAFLESIRLTSQFESQQNAISRDCIDLDKRYEVCKSAVLDHEKRLQNLLTQSQGVSAGIDEMMKWLQAAEQEVSQHRPIPMNRDKLEEQRKEQQLLLSEIEGRGPALEGLRMEVEKLLASSPSAANAALPSTMAELNKRYDILERRCRAWGDNLHTAAQNLDEFSDKSKKLDDWLNGALSALEAKDLSGEDPDAYMAELERIQQEAAERRNDLQTLKCSGSQLMALPNASEVSVLQQSLSGVDPKFAQLQERLAVKQREAAERQRQRGAYEDQRAKVNDWLHSMEERTEVLAPPSLRQHLLHEQIGETKDLLKEHSRFLPDVELLNRLGHEVDASQRSAEPTVSSGTPQPEKRRRRGERDTPLGSSYFKPAGSASPGGGSTASSSGIGSYTDNLASVAADELTPTQRDLLDANRRYELLGSGLNDRHVQLDTTLNQLEIYEINRDELSAWVDRGRQRLGSLPLPLSTQETSTLLQDVQKTNDQVKDRRRAYDSIKEDAHELTRLKQADAVAGLQEVKDAQARLDVEWNALHDELHAAQTRILDAKDFHNTYGQMHKWVGAKENMLAVLGPVGAEPHMIQNQLQQVKVMKEECESHKPNLDQLNQSGVSLQEGLPQPSEDAEKLSKQVGDINEKWNDLLVKLDDRERNLSAATELSEKLLAKQHQIRDWLEPLNLQVEQLARAAPSSHEMDHHLALIDSIGSQLETKANDLDEMATVCEQLSEISGDPKVRADIFAKLQAMKQPHDELKHKIQSLEDAAKGAMAEGMEFGQQFSNLLDWLNVQKSNIDNLQPVSAILQKLKVQQNEFDPIYQDIQTREAEVSLVRAKALEALKKDPNNSIIKERLQQLESQWNPVLTGAKDRRDRLQRASEVAHSFERESKLLEQYLDEDERQLEALGALAAPRGTDECAARQRAVDDLRNAVSAQTATYHQSTSLGDKLMYCTQTDAEHVQDIVDTYHDRWEAVEDGMKRFSRDADKQMQHWTELNQALAELNSSLGHCEEQALKTPGRDPQSLGRLRALVDDLEGPVGRKVKLAGESASKLERLLGEQSTKPKDQVDGDGDVNGEPVSRQMLNPMEAKAAALLHDLKEKIASLEGSEDLQRQMQDKSNALARDMKQLSQDFVDLGHLAREPDHLRSQDHQTDDFLVALKDKKRSVEDAKSELESLSQNELEPAALKQLQDQVHKFEEDISGLQAKGDQRKVDIANLLEEIENLLEDMDGTNNGIVETLSSDVLQQPISTDVEGLKGQLETLGAFKTGLEPLSNRVEGLLNSARGLVKSAGPGVDTSRLETDSGRLGDAWNELQSRLSDRQKQIDGALLGVRNYKDTLNSLLGWLEETDDHIKSQSAPSSDHKVVKAQLQGQQMLQKMIDDKQQSVEGFCQLAEQLERSAADDHEREKIRQDQEEVASRYDRLMADGHQRRAALQEALDLCKQWSDTLQPTLHWLDKAERAISKLDTVPTDQEKLREQINDHQAMHEDIEAKQGDLDELIKIGEDLCEVVSPDDADALSQQLHDTVDRYNKLSTMSEQMGILLGEMENGIGAFLANTEYLAVWIDDAEARLAAFDPLPVYVDALTQHSQDLMVLAEEINEQQTKVTAVVEEGRELCKHTSGDEAVALQAKLDGLRLRYNELSSRAQIKLGQMEEALPLAESFHDANFKLSDWLTAIESDLSRLDEASLQHQHELLKNMNEDIVAFRPELDRCNATGARLAQMSPGEGANDLNQLTTTLNKRFDAVCEQVQKRGFQLDMVRSRANEVLGEMENLTDWFHKAEARLQSAGAASADPVILKQQLKDQRLLDNDIHGQKGRLRDLLGQGRKMLADFSTTGADTQDLQERMEVLSELSEGVTSVSAERLNWLEQALPLAEHFAESHQELDGWLGDMETELVDAPEVVPGLYPDQLRKQQDLNKAMSQLLQAQRPMVDKFEKTGCALADLCNEEDSANVRDALQALIQRYEELKEQVRARGLALDDALLSSSEFSDRLQGMLESLSEFAGQMRSAEPIAARPDKIRAQIQENSKLMNELEQKASVYEGVRSAAQDIMHQADPHDPAVGEIENKMGRLAELWDEIQSGTETRGRDLADTLQVAERFWDELQDCVKALKDLKKRLEQAEAPASNPEEIESQQQDLQEIATELEAQAPRVDAVKASGAQLLDLIGFNERPEVEQRMHDLDGDWDTVTELYHRRNADLIEAMERAMEFHDILRKILEWLEGAETRAEGFPPVGLTLDEIRQQLADLEEFKKEFEEKAVEKEQLSQQAQALAEGGAAARAGAVRRPVQELTRRWDRLGAALNDRQQKLEKALLEMGQFEQAYDQLMDWMDKSRHTCDEITPAPGDQRQTEIEIAKHKVLSNDVLAHQRSVDTLNEAGRKLMASVGDDAKRAAAHSKVDALNQGWDALQQALKDKLAQLEDCRSEAESFGGQLQRWLIWMEDVDAQLSSTKPIAGLPDNARNQLENFSYLEEEIDRNRAEIEEAIFRGDEHVHLGPENSNSTVAAQVDNVRKKWEALQTKAKDRKKKLEICLADAEECARLMAAFTDWLTQAETKLNSLPQVSRLMDGLLPQIDDHKVLQDEVQAKREEFSVLNTKGTTIQYRCETADRICIKNLLVNSKMRFDKIISRTADRTKALDIGYQEAKAFYDSWEELCSWCKESKEWLDNQKDLPATSPDKIKQQLDRHKELQAELGTRQKSYDATTKMGKQLRDHAPKSEQPALQQMLDELRDKWNALANGAVERQTKLEESLLFCGQFKDAVAALLDWLAKVQPNLADEKNVYGDLETVTNLVDQHKNFKAELKGRKANVDTVRKAAEELINSGDSESRQQVQEQMAKLDESWENICQLSDRMETRLQDAYKDAEEFHKGAHTMLEWLSDMEMKLKFAGQMPNDEKEINEQMAKLEELKKEMDEREKDLDASVELGRSIQSHCHVDAEQPMKHWMNILQARWEEVSAMCKQRSGRLEGQLSELKEQEALLDELLRWLASKENELHNAEEVAIPEDLELIEQLIKEHEEFETDLRNRQGDVDEATKGKRKDASEPSASTSTDTGAKPAKTDGKGIVRRPSNVKKGASKHPKAQQLSDRWRQLWLQSMERQRKLQDLLAYLKELKELEKFSFEQWRQRYNNWIDNKKSRVMDFFRRLDRDGNGKVSRHEFIDGILASKFPTSRLEMNKVADLFDKGDGMIDYRQFIAALRTDRSPSTQKPMTDAQKIKDEVHKHLEMCTCPHKFQAREVGEGKYRFGSNQKLRLVRILRSTVMVRVGGGWEALDEFLVKNDPCRAKGRTNLELREQFILADGVKQNMRSFTSRRTPVQNGSSQASGSSGAGSISRSSPRLSATPLTAGPITKIREKTDRSVPMSKHWRSGKSPAGSPNDSEISSLTSASRRSSGDLLSPDYGYGRPSSRRGARAGSQSGSRPPSRALNDTPATKPASRPPSRADSIGSDISLDSRDSLSVGRPTRIPSLRGKKSVPYTPKNK